MPYCSQCGNHVANEDLFCARCGFRQPAAGYFPTPAPVHSQTDFLNSIPDRTFSILCYIPVLGWVPAVVVLGMKRFRGDLKMRFHAFQGLYVFAAWLLVDWAIAPLFESMHHVFRVDSILKSLLMVVWIFMLVKTSQGEAYELPLVGELAQRLARGKA